MDFVESDCCAGGEVVEEEQDQHGVCAAVDIVCPGLALFATLGEGGLDVGVAHVGLPCEFAARVLLAVVAFEAHLQSLDLRWVDDLRLACVFCLFILLSHAECFQWPSHGCQDVDAEIHALGVCIAEAVDVFAVAIGELF